MKIKTEDFENKGEVDITAHYSDRNEKGRLSIRQNEGRYEVYVRWHRRKIEEVLHKGTLEECVFFTNARVGLNDEVE